MVNVSKLFLINMLAMAAISTPSLAMGQKSTTQEQMTAVSFRVGDFPVWVLNESKEPLFDASVLMSRIRNEIKPEIWKSGSARLVQSVDDESLILVATRSEYSGLANEISSLLETVYAFSEHDVKSRLGKNLKLAESGGERVILLCTHADSTFYKNFVRASSEDSKLKRLFSQNFIVQCVPSSKGIDLKEQGVSFPSEFGAGFTILDANGRPLANKDFDSWDEETTNALAEFAQRSVKEFADAKTILNDGLVEAKKQNKKLLLQMSGPGCGACIMLTRYLEANKKLVGKDFVHIKLDMRMANAEEVKNSYGSEFEKIPWIVILSSSREPLANGLSPKGNIGFPRAAFQQEHFRRMLTSTSENLTEADIAALIDELPKLPKIK